MKFYTVKYNIHINSLSDMYDSEYNDKLNYVYFLC